MKRERRSEPMWDASKREARGRAVEPTVAGFERALQIHGVDGVRVALISRNNQRWENIRTSSAYLTTAACHPLSRLVQLDWALVKLGQPLSGNPGQHGSGWLNQLMWAVDSMAAYARFGMLGGYVGAAAIARSQIERWTLNLAFNRGIKSSGDMEAFMKEVWEPYQQTPYHAWAMLSEVLHGRGWGQEAILWEAFYLMQPADEHFKHLGLISVADPALDLAMIPVRNGLLTYGDEHGIPLPELRRMDKWSGAVFDQWPAHRVVALWQLDHNILGHEGTKTLPSASIEYERVLKTIRSWPPLDLGGLTALSFLARRGRAVASCLQTFAKEETLLGDGFNPAKLSDKDYRRIIICEMAGLLAGWWPSEGTTALAVAASATRSAFLLWLEDDTRSMTCVRTMLEATARARTWRLKPEKATKLTDAGSTTTPRDWLEAAGWRRLGLLLRSLGEFSHITERTARTMGDAWEMLTRLQMDPPGYTTEMSTARGHALEKVMWLLAAETREWVRALAPRIGDAFEEILGILAAEDLEVAVEGWLNYAFGLKKEFPK